MLRTALSVLLLVTAGCKTSDPVETSAPSNSAGGSAAESAVIRVVADGKGYTPNSITVQRGKPATIEFVRTSDDTCAKEVNFPDLGVNKPLPLNSPVRISVPTDASKTYAFACGMDMFKGQLIVQ